MVRRCVGVWHEGVAHWARKHVLRKPRDIILATPESVDVMLVSRVVDHCRLLAGLRAVVLEEVHSFAGDDRGWHLLSLLEPITEVGREPVVQRIALSATLAKARSAWPG